MRALLERIVIAWALLGGLILLAIVIVTVTNVGAFGLDRIARLFGTTVSGLPGYEDFVRLAVSPAVLMLFPYCQLRRGHVAVDLFVNLAPPTVQKTLDSISIAGMIGLAVFLAYWMTLGMFETLADGALSRVLGWPEWPFYAPGILSLVFWALVATQQLFRSDADG